MTDILICQSRKSTGRCIALIRAVFGLSGNRAMVNIICPTCALPVLSSQNICFQGIG